MVAPNGGRRTAADHPALPVSPAELAATAVACLAAGAAAMHLHVRDAAGGHLLDADAYRAALSAVRGAVGGRLFLQITSEALGRYQPEEQMAVIRAVRPEGVSLALREFVRMSADEAAFAGFLRWLKAERVAPQFILYSAEEVDRMADLCRRGLVPWDEPPVLFVLGRYTLGQTSVPEDLHPFLAPGRRRFADWMVCAFGRNEAACVLAGANAGGHARVGFENNLHLPDGAVAPDNAALVAATAQALRAGGHRLVDAAGLRARWLTL